MKIHILCNWEKQKIIHCPSTGHSLEFRALIGKGYVKVGEINQKTPDSEVKLFWKEDFFHSRDKYQRELKYHEQNE